MPKEERRSTLLAFRVRSDEAKRIEAAAAAQDVKVATWIRDAVLRALGRRKDAGK